jgi:hypothetical protein
MWGIIMNRDDLESRCKRVVNQERCKHGMIFEYCALCNEIKIPREYKVPIDIVDKETGDEKRIFIRGITEDVYYYHYRDLKGLPQDRTQHFKGKSAHFALKSFNPRH